MFTRMAITNFRAFRGLEVDDLAPINLFTGFNNAGKTSLLEALFLLSGGGNPELATNVNVVRGLVGGDGVAALWNELFTNLDVGKTIEVAATHQSLGELMLEVESGVPNGVETITPANGSDVPDATTNLPKVRGLSFSFRRGSQQSQGHIRLNGPAVEVSRPAADIPFPATILVARGGDVHGDAMRLGELRRQKRGDLLLKALRIVEPRLAAIEDNSASGQPMIWGDVGFKELVPLPVMGEGMTRIARIVLAVSATPKGAVLIDEIENGFHHSVLKDVWQVVEEAAHQFGTQVFATTHSLECARAAHQGLSPDVFRLHRLEVDGEENRCVTYGAEAMVGAMDHDLEVR